MSPPTDDGRYWARTARPQPAQEPAASRTPPFIEYDALNGLPMPIQLAATAAMLPYEAAVASVKILKNTEALLGELVLHLRALRPAVAAVSDAYAAGHFDPMFKTFDQIQSGTNAIAFFWAPLNAVREAVAPGQYRREIINEPPPPMARPAGPVASAGPSATEWLGDVGSWVLGQASALPGGLFPGPLRRIVRPRPGEEPPAMAGSASAAPTRPPGTAVTVPTAWQPPIPPMGQPSGAPGAQTVAEGATDTSVLAPVLDRVGFLVPGPMRRLFGGG
jgi:hypothetical protein